MVQTSPDAGALEWEALVLDLIEVTQSDRPASIFAAPWSFFRSLSAG
jgi:hypothetical protein